MMTIQHVLGDMLIDQIARRHYWDDRAQLAEGETLEGHGPIGYETGAMTVRDDLYHMNLDSRHLNGDELAELETAVTVRYQSLHRDDS